MRAVYQLAQNASLRKRLNREDLGGNAGLMFERVGAAWNMSKRGDYAPDKNAWINLVAGLSK